MKNIIITIGESFTFSNTDAYYHFSKTILESFINPIYINRFAFTIYYYSSKIKNTSQLAQFILVKSRKKFLLSKATLVNFYSPRSYILTVLEYTYCLPLKKSYAGRHRGKRGRSSLVLRLFPLRTLC